MIALCSLELLPLLALLFRCHFYYWGVARLRLGYAYLASWLALGYCLVVISGWLGCCLGGMGWVGGGWRGIPQPLTLE